VISSVQVDARWRRRSCLVVSIALAALLVGCTEEGQEAVRDRIEEAVEDAELEGSELPIDRPTETEPGTESAAETETETKTETEAEAEADTEAATEAVTEPETEAVTEPETEAVTEPETEAVTEPETEAVTEPETEAVTEPETEAETEDTVVAADEQPAYGWLLLLALVVIAATAVAIGNHRQTRREQAALLDRALIDVDWLLSASADRPAAGEVATRTLDVRTRADRVHDTLGKLAAHSDGEVARSVLVLRDDVAALATIVVQRYGTTGPGVADLDVRLGEQRERVRIARLALRDDRR
jgi:hypothetical protein